MLSAAHRTLLFAGQRRSLAEQALLAETAGLAFDARDMSAYVKGHTTPFKGEANSLFTYSSPSTKYVRNAAGLLVPGTTLRCDHDASGNKLGLLIEEQRTNLLLRSEEFGTSPWAVNNSSDTGVSADAVAAPDGTLTGDKLFAKATASTAHYVQQSVTVTNAAHSFSVYLKAAEKTWGLVWFNTLGKGAYFNLSTGVVGTTSAGATASIENVGNGWYRCTITATLAAGTETPAVYIGVSDNVYLFAGSGSDGLYVWGDQLEAGAFATSYIATAGSQVTRAADAITLATSSFPFSATAGILVVEARTAPGTGTHVLAQIDDGTANERIRIVRNTSNEIHCVVTDGGSDVCDLNLGAVANDTAFKVAFSWAANDFAASLNGGAVQTDTGGTLPTVTTLRLGSGNSAYWNGRLLKARQLPRNRTSNAELQAMAA